MPNEYIEQLNPDVNENFNLVKNIISVDYSDTVGYGVFRISDRGLHGTIQFFSYYDPVFPVQRWLKINDYRQLSPTYTLFDEYYNEIILLAGFWIWTLKPFAERYFRVHTALNTPVKLYKVKCRDIKYIITNTLNMDAYWCGEIYLLEEVK